MIENVANLIRTLRGDLKAYVVQRVASAIRFGQVTKNSASGNADAIQGNETERDEQDGGYQYTVRRLWPFGIRSVPPTGIDAVVVHAFGGPTNGILVGAESAEYGPSNLQVGETAIYNKVTGAVIKIDVDGKITIDAPAGVDVVVNGGTLKVARVTDSTTGHVHTAGTLMCPNTGTGIAVAVTGSTASATDTIASGAGAARFKA